MIVLLILITSVILLIISTLFAYYKNIKLLYIMTGLTSFIIVVCLIYLFMRRGENRIANMENDNVRLELDESDMAEIQRIKDMIQADPNRPAKRYNEYSDYLDDDNFESVNPYAANYETSTAGAVHSESGYMSN